MAAVVFRFYEELNDFLAPARRKRSFEHEVARDATVKHAVEALGVPHTEVELILVNGESVGFDHRLADGDRVSVYPVFEAFDVSPLVRVRAHALREPRFVADAHLGRLARYLRFLGFDTLYENAWHDRDLVALAEDEARTVLTRDRALLMHRELTHGLYVRAIEPLAQLHEVLRRLQLDGAMRGRTSRCLLCNTVLEPVAKADIAHRLLPNTLSHHDRFWRCPRCDRVYWRGSHWQRLDRVTSGPQDSEEPP